MLSKPKYIYQLSKIPGFIFSIKNPDKDHKYYTIQTYNNKYLIVRYDKEFLCSDLIDTYGLLRSIIFSEKKMVCFSPPKSLSMDNFMQQYPIKTENIVAEEFVEGTMMNVFFDTTINDWQMATRNTVGADTSFFKTSSITFRQMFIDACIYNNFNIQMLNPMYCYSFVLQHPLNRIVTPFKTPKLYLVEMYQIIQNESGILVVTMDMKKEKLSHINFPEKYEFRTYTELIEKFASGNTPYDIMGVVIKNETTGERTKFRNPIYEEVRHLRGNQPKRQYQYLCLRYSGKLANFLKYYPETKPEMSMFRDQVHMFTQNLHKNYISCYVKKNTELKKFSGQYKTHMFNLHQHYLNELMPNKLYVTNTETIKYVNKLHPSLLMYCLNYNMRKRMLDVSK